MNPRGRPRGKGGSPICSSIPRHGAGIRTKTQSITERWKQKERKKKPKADCKLAQKKKKKYSKNLYDAWIVIYVMMHALMPWI